MGPIGKGATVAVTGAAGFVGGWIVRQLLDKGYRVRACVRNTSDDSRVGFLKAMPGYASGRLSLWSADLDQPGCFNEAFQGVGGVAHISHVSNYDDEAYIRGVCEHVIASINGSDSIARVVVTSSIAAIMSESDMQELVRRPVIYEGRWPDETNPKRTAERGQGYSIGKVMAERIFSDAAAASGRWEAITCCPGDVLGPIQSAHQKEAGPWQHFIETMLTGHYLQNGAYRPWMTVDVRDVAACHIGLLESTMVKNGERYLAASGVKRNVEDICADIGRLLPELRFAAPAVTDPFPAHIKAREARYRGIWSRTDIRNDRVRAVTGVNFRSNDESVRDCVESLLSLAAVQVVTRPEDIAQAS